MHVTEIAAIADELLPPTEPPSPSRDAAWMLRRLRVVARRRVRVDIVALGSTARIVSDGELVIGLETVSERDPRVLAWRSNRVVDVVVVHDGCGARILGDGGVAGRIEVPAALGPDAFLAFCYDTEPGPSGL